MLLTLAFRHFLVRKRRALFLLLGFALGVGVMMVLLSVGEAMVSQSRDVSLVGGGEVTVLPQGIDVEALRTGGIGGMFFGIERARYVTRQLVGGPRERGAVAAVAPAIANKLLYLAREGDAAPAGRAVPVRAGGEIPSRARAVGAGLRVVAGRWDDTPADSAWVAPTTQQLYDQLDHFHLPPTADTTWGEWHYFNVVRAPDEWWYLTFLVGGAVGRGRWGGQLLATHRRPDGRYERFAAALPPEAVTLDTARADLTLGPDSVRQRDGVYHVVALAAAAPGQPGASGPLRVDLTIRPLPNRYFPPVELSEDVFLSGYVVPGLAAEASGTLCAGARCVQVDGAPAYHDHNWGTWRGVTWEWGAARGASLSLLYGGVYGPEGVTATTASPFFIALVDSLGLRQVLRFRTIEYEGARPAAGASDVVAPARFTLLAARESDTVRLAVTVDDALATRTAAAGFGRAFVQMRGRFALDGRIAGQAVRDTGAGFFETYVRAQSPSRSRTPAVR